MSKYTDKLCGMDAYGRYVPTQDGKKTDKEVNVRFLLARLHGQKVI